MDFSLLEEYYAPKIDLRPTKKELKLLKNQATVYFKNDRNPQEGSLNFSKKFEQLEIDSGLGDSIVTNTNSSTNSNCSSNRNQNQNQKSLFLFLGRENCTLSDLLIDQLMLKKGKSNLLNLTEIILDTNTKINLSYTSGHHKNSSITKKFKIDIISLNNYIFIQSPDFIPEHLIGKLLTFIFDEKNKRRIFGFCLGSTLYGFPTAEMADTEASLQISKCVILENKLPKETETPYFLYGADMDVDTDQNIEKVLIASDFESVLKYFLEHDDGELDLEFNEKERDGDGDEAGSGSEPLEMASPDPELPCNPYLQPLPKKRLNYNKFTKYFITFLNSLSTKSKIFSKSKNVKEIHYQILEEACGLASIEGLVDFTSREFLELDVEDFRAIFKKLEGKFGMSRPRIYS